MALTAAQQTKMDELKTSVDDFEQTYKGSPTMMNHGSYFFDVVADLRNKIDEIEKA